MSEMSGSEEMIFETMYEAVDWIEAQVDQGGADNLIGELVEKLDKLGDFEDGSKEELAIRKFLLDLFSELT